MRTLDLRSGFRLSAAALALAGALSACADPAPLAPARAPAPVLVSPAPGTVRQDPAEIVSARIEGDLLLLSVRYGGGCREHRFALYHDGVFLESDPVQLHLRLAHDAQGDNCRALVGRELTFDLTPVQEAYRGSYGGGGGTVVLHLHAPGAAEPFRPALRYQF